ncbi:MAG: DUF1800 domain-containing protein [Pyrinomonadaceae bacterium]
MIIFSVSTFAENDSDPNSPIPILISQKDSARALANFKNETVTGARLTGKTISDFRDENAGGAFDYKSEIVIYITNYQLMNGENANAFRVYIEDQNGKEYRFPVSQIEPVKGYEWVLALTVNLRDEIGFWKEEPAVGDVYLRVSWRGNSTNRVLLGIGKIGGKIKSNDESKPTPFPENPPGVQVQTDDYVGYKYSGDRIRFLEQATFGPTTALDDRVRRIGLRVWLAEQFEAPYPSASNPYPNLALKSTDVSNVTAGCGVFPTDTAEYRVCTRDFYSMYLVQNWFFKESLYGDSQLRHRLAWALSQMWVVSGVDTQQASWMIAYHQKLSANSFGNYRTLMKDMSLNPAMGNYLDMIRSTKNNPNENYPREILQLFSIGLFMLNQDGTLQLDGQGSPIPTYNQTTVNNFTKVFTGWTACENTALCPNRTQGAPNYKDPMLLNQTNHDVGAKTLLAYPNAVNPTIAAGLNGDVEIDLALDNIFNHPNVAPFVSKQLIQHLVTSDPSPAYVGRISAVFNNNGQNIRGDLKAVVKAILLDPEARGNIKTDPNYGKLREPVQLITNFLKHFNVRSADGSQPSDGVINGQTSQISQDVFRSPTVFNYYPPGYVIPGTSLLGPEFGILTTGTAIGRLNRINTLTFSRISVSLPNTPLGTSIDLSEMIALSQSDSTGNQLIDTLNTRMMHGSMQPAMKNTILTAVQAVASTNPTLRAQTAIYLTATSSQYQIQR